jgi:valine dehydrogenase (NAD+)
MWGAPTLAGKRVAVAGVGKVGHHLVEHLLDDGASVCVADVSNDAIARMRSARPEVEVVDVDALVSQPMDVYAPCALGGALNDATVEVLQAKIVCGAANNQLDHPGIEKVLADRGVLYAPDYVVNAGGLVQVADEIEGFNFDRAKAHAARIFDTTKRVFAIAKDEGVPPAVAADRFAERRMAEVGRLRGLYLR